MALPSPKELKRLAAACRAAGISSFKGDGVEFTLSDEAPVSKYKKSKAKIKSTNYSREVYQNIETDEPSPEALLFWSSGFEDESQGKQ